MFESIVVGTDGSSTAGEAVRKAVELARISGADVHLVHAYRPAATAHASSVAVASGVPPLDLVHLDERLRNDAELLLARAARVAGADGVHLACHARPGQPADVLMTVAEEEGADLIVVGNRGMSGVRRFVLGSVPNRVAHNSPCTVMVVHTC